MGDGDSDLRAGSRLDPWRGHYAGRAAGIGFRRLAQALGTSQRMIKVALQPIET